MTVSSTASIPPSALFQGYNSVLGNGLSTAVEGASASDGAKSEVRCSVCISVEELAKSLSIDQSLSVGFGPVFSVDEKVSFMTSLKVTTYSVSVTVYARHQAGATSRTDVGFKPGIKPPANAAEANTFVQIYGDSFVSRLATGGEYMAVYTFYSQSKEEQTSLVSSLSASGVFSGVTVGGSLQSAMTSFLKTVTVNYTFRQTVTGLKNPALPLPDQFIDYAVKFPSIALDAPVIISIASAGYETVPGAGNGFKQVAANRTYFTGDGVSGGLTESLTSITQSDNQITWIAAIYELYGGYRDTTLEDNAKTAKNDIKAIHAQMSRFATEPTASFSPLSLKALQNGTPCLKYDIHDSGYWGGSGGGPFNDVDISTYLQRQTRITAISLRSGERTDQLCTTFADDGGKPQTKCTGGNGGTSQGTLQVLPGQFVTKVWGRSGGTLDQLWIQLSDGRTFGGGENGGSPFEWRVPDGCFFMGFKGRSGTEIDGIQMTYAKLQPAIWKV